MRSACLALSDTVGDVGAGGSVGRYELLVPVARGGMAVVWAARLKGDRGFQKLVALKAMLPGLSDDPRIEEMFLDEARFASQIKHPHVCSVLDLGEHDGALYLVMEWVDGETVSSLQKAVRAQGAFPMALAVRIAMDAATGLHAAHELESDAGDRIELVHRDVSPQNILVTRDGVVKIVDFGVAKAISQSFAVQTDAGLIKGKFAFMSPEQAEAGDVDRRTDVFALALVLYQMITGAHPFRCEAPTATLERIKTATVTPPRELAPECPQSLSDVIMKALEKDPQKRFRTMTEFARALDRTRAEIPAGDVEEDLAAFVSRVAGERIDRRRATIKEAIRVADERRGSDEPLGQSRSSEVADETTLVSEPTIPTVPPEVLLDPRQSTSAPAIEVSMARPSSSRRAFLSVAGVAAIGLVALAGVTAARGLGTPVGSATTAVGETARAIAARPTPAFDSPADTSLPALTPDALEPVVQEGQPLQPAAGDAPTAPLPGALPRAQGSGARPIAPPSRDASKPGDHALPTVRDPGF